MKTGKLFGLLLLAVCAAFTSCDEDDDEYTKAAVSGSQVYFSTELPVTQEVSMEASETEIPISRLATEGELTVEFDVVASTDIYTIPTSVTFADGEATAPLKITYDPAAVNYDEYTIVSIKLKDETMASEWGQSSYAFQIGCPAPFTEWGAYITPEGKEATTCDWEYTLLFSGLDEDLKLEYRENTANPNIAQFKIANALAGVDVIMNYDKETGDLIIPETFAGTTYGSYGNIYVSDLRTYQDNMPAGYFDTENGIMELNIIYYVSAGYLNYGTEYVYLDGYNRKDLTTSVTYAGKFEDAEENIFVVANATLGADVESAKLALIPGKLTQETFDAILGGTYEPLYDVTASGDVKVPANDLEDGEYSFVLVSYSEGEAVAYDDATFNFTKGAKVEETWTALYTGTYTYTLFFGSPEEPVADEGLVLHRSDLDPTRYKITNWGYGVDFIFTMDESGNVVVQDNETGYAHPTHGMVSAVDYTLYTGQTDASSYFDAETNTFKFALFYFVEAGYLNYGYETFVLTGTAPSEAKSRAFDSQKKNLKVAKTATPVKVLSNKPIESPVVIKK